MFDKNIYNVIYNVAQTLKHTLRGLIYYIKNVKLYLFTRSGNIGG